MTSTKKRSVSFSDDVRNIPEDILEPYSRVFSPETDPFCQSLGVCPATLLRCTRLIQGFIRDNVSHWTYFNKERCRILEELDNIEVMKRGELDRVEMFRSEMKREVEMESATDFDREKVEGNPGMMKSVEEQKQQIRDLEADNATLKQQMEETKKENKKLAMGTFKLYESFPRAVSDRKRLEAEKTRLEEIRDKFGECRKTLKGLMKILKRDISREREERSKLEICINEIISVVEERYSKRKLIEKIVNLRLTVESQVQTIEAS